jgi:hypothetical protein
LLRQTLLFFNYFFTVFLHNSKQNRGYDTATQGERREGRKDFKKTPHPYPLPQSVAVSQLSFSRIFADLFRQTLLFLNYFLPYFLHNRKQNRGYDTATKWKRKKESIYISV